MKSSLVLCYHAVSPAWEADISVTPEALERQVGGLLRRGWRVASFREAMTAPAPGTMAITFDDAFHSVHEHALPVLRALGVTATVFAPTAFMATGTLAWPGIDHWLQGPSAGELRAMTWSDLGELAELGWEIGSHTCTHPRLTQLDDAALTRELTESRQECARQLDRVCDTLAYPYGDFDERVARRATEAGYVACATLTPLRATLGADTGSRVGIYHEDTWLRFRLKTSLESWSKRYLRLRSART
ncbi:MAG: polysaccharide deacetylase family protein [Solirubrobacteraceae bacterium]